MKADIAIIGGGATGLTIAWHLARRLAGKGVRVVVLDREPMACCGQTAKAVGGRRDSFSTAPNILFSRFSSQVFREERTFFGEQAEFQEYGYLFAYSTEAEVEQARKNVALQNSLGVRSEMIGPEVARKLLPALLPDKVLAGTFCPTDGLFNPYGVGMAYWQNLLECKDVVKMLWECTVLGIRRSGPETYVLNTSKGPVEAPKVVLAAGPWSLGLAEGLGLENFPCKPYRRQYWITGKTAFLPHPLPFFFHTTSTLYCRRESAGGGIYLSITDKGAPPTLEENTTYENELRVTEALCELLDVPEDVRIIRGVAGLYDVTPDAHALMGAVPGLPGFYVAAGYSGHGVMHAPAIGTAMSELILDGESKTLDLHPFRLERFQEEGQTQGEKIVL